MVKPHTPQIAWHDRDQVLSVDIQQKPLPITSPMQSPDHPSSSSIPPEVVGSYRVATSGNDRHIVIWRVNVVHKMVKQKDALGLVKVTKVEVTALAELTRHEKAVNVVRFAPTG